MRAVNFLRILGVTATLAAYASWGLAVREPAQPTPEASVPATDIPLLRLADTEALWRAGLSVFVDVRSPGDYEVGHIAGAINIPDEDFERRLPDLRPRLERARAVVVYCKSRDCGKSLWCAIRLRQAGFLQTKIYPNGWNEWYNGGLPVARGRG